jgi:hypothetical protein
MTIDNFISNYYPFVFDKYSIKYFNNPENIFNIYSGVVGQSVKSNRDGLIIRFGPKRCGEECGDCFFEFAKINNQ